MDSHQWRGRLQSDRQPSAGLPKLQFLDHQQSPASAISLLGPEHNSSLDNTLSPFPSNPLFMISSSRVFLVGLSLVSPFDCRDRLFHVGTVAGTGAASFDLQVHDRWGFCSSGTCSTHQKEPSRRIPILSPPSALPPAPAIL